MCLCILVHTVFSLFPKAILAPWKGQLLSVHLVSYHDNTNTYFGVLRSCVIRYVLYNRYILYSQMRSHHPLINTWSSNYLYRMKQTVINNVLFSEDFYIHYCRCLRFLLPYRFVFYPCAICASGCSCDTIWCGIYDTCWYLYRRYTSKYSIDCRWLTVWEFVCACERLLF